MKKTLLALILTAGSTFAQYPNSAGTATGAPGYDPSAGAYPAPGQDPYSMGPGAGAPGNYPPPAGYGLPAGAYAAPAVCGPGYVWIGYCAVPPFAGAYWVGPSFIGGRFVAGYWGRGGGGYAPGFGIRGGYANRFRAPAAAAPGFRSQGGYRASGPATRGGGSGRGGRR